MTERLARFAVTDLSTEQRAIYDAITQGPRGRGRQLFPLTDDAGALAGPYNAMLLNPALGSALQALGSAVRYQGTLADRAREIAILVVARHWRSAFETYAHEAVAGSVGVTDAEIDALRDGRTDVGDYHERLVAATALALVARGDLTDEEFTTARDGLGMVVLFELITIVGYYATLALQLRVFRVSVPTS